MRIKMDGNKRDMILTVFKNNDTVTIPAGTPLVLSISATVADTVNDGLLVCLPSTAGAIDSNSLMYGVSVTSVAVNNYGEAIVFGVANYALFNRATRSASSASWSSSASLPAGQILCLDTINNCFTVASASLASGNFAPFAVLLDNVASMAASASVTSDSRTAIVTTQRVFVRML